VPPDLPALGVLAVLATAVQGKYVVEVSHGYTEELSIWTAVVLEPAERKSAALLQCTKPLTDWEVEQRIKMKEQIEAAKQERRIIEARLQKAEARAARAGSPDEEREAEYAAKDVRLKLDAVPKLNYPRLQTDDTTPEGLVGVMVVQDGRIGLFSTEGGGFFSILQGRYSDHPNIESFLKAHCGDPIQVDRRHSEPLSIPRPNLSIGLTLQPAVLKHLDRSKIDFKGRGLFGRFFWSLPEGRQGRRDARVPPMPEDAATNYRDCVHDLLVLPQATDELGQPVPIQLYLSEGAEKWRQALHYEIEPELSESGGLRHMSDWAGKLVGAAVRIAGVLHCVKYSTNPASCQIDAETFEKACDIAQYLLEHAKVLYGHLCADQGVEAAHHILKHIEKRRAEAFSQRDIHQWTKGKLTKVAEVKEGLKVLEEHNYVRRIGRDPQRGPGQPRSSSWELNPEFFRIDPQYPQYSNSEDSEEVVPGSSNGKPVLPAVHEELL